MLAKILTSQGWVFGKIVGDKFVTPSGRQYQIDDDGNVNYNGEICKVIRATY
jgi:hypothetical protein